SEEFARKQVMAKPYLANPAPINQQNYVSNQLLVDCSGRTTYCPVSGSSMYSCCKTNAKGGSAPSFDCAKASASSYD
ncbi:hypothetical protein, partial [Acidovorax sp.]|uniref:hypothetical protein n=1 Tax=Acidovorax sp. TaxID=1872122 RepID=UPI0025C4A1EF